MGDQITAKAAYDMVVPEAEALSEGEVREYRLDPDLAMANVNTAMKFFDRVKESIPKRLAGVDVAKLEKLPVLALATQYAAMTVDHVAPSEKTVNTKIKEVAGLRRKVLSALVTLVENGLIPESELDPILPGKGPRDAAEDCVACVRVLRQYEKKIENQHPLTQQTMTDAEEAGSWLMQHLRHGHAPREKAGPPPAEMLIRDRIATLLVQQYEELEFVAHRYEGKNWERAVPPLMSRVRISKEEERPM